MSDVPLTRYARASRGGHVPYQVVGEGHPHLLMLTDGPAPIDVFWEEPSLVRIRDRLASFTTTVWCGAVGWESPDEVAAVLDALGVSEIAMVAIGYAGATAMAYAAAHPEQIRSLILVNTFAFYGQDDDFPSGLAADVIASLSAADATSLLAGEPGLALDAIAPSRASDERFRQWFGKARRLYDARAVAHEIAVRVFQVDNRPLLPKVRVPTLVLHRRGNRFIRVSAGRYLAEHIEGAKYVELPGDDHLFFAGDVDGLVDEIEEFLTGIRQAPEGDGVVAVVLFTDIVNSTDQQARIGHRAWTKLIEEHDALTRAAFQRHRGREIKTTGDGFLATFDGVARAVRCSAAILAEAAAIGLDLRAGLHAGEVEVRASDLAGLAVTIARRICDTAGPREVLVSSAIPPMLTGSAIGFSARGVYALKGVPGAWRLYAAEL